MEGKKKPLDVAINLVPFIDLMAVTISFLVMTAVWSQIGRLTVTQSGGPSDSPAPPDMKTLPLNLLVTERGFTLSSGGSAIDIPKVDGKYVMCHKERDVIDAPEKCEENTLINALRKVKAEVPDQRNITVQCEDGVKYSDLVRVIDACNLKDSTDQPVLFPDVAVSAVG